MWTWELCGNKMNDNSANTQVIDGPTGWLSEQYAGIILTTHGRNVVQFAMLMYLDYFQNRSDFGHDLLILLISPEV